MIQEFSDGLDRLCRQQGLNYLSVFDIIYPRFNETLSNDHYLSCDEKSCKGEVGKIVLQIAVKALAGT
jgi:hypothetical protein